MMIFCNIYERSVICTNVHSKNVAVSRKPNIFLKVKKIFDYSHDCFNYFIAL